MQCEQARDILERYYFKHPVAPDEVQEAKSHVAHCFHCAARGAEVVRATGFGPDMNVSCDECQQLLHDYVASEGKEKGVGKRFGRVENHLAYCRSCRRDYQTLRSISMATEEELKSIQYREFDLSFLGKKPKEQLHKLVIEFLRGIIGVVEHTGRVVQGEELVLRPLAEARPVFGALLSPVGDRSGRGQVRAHQKFVQMEVDIDEHTSVILKVARGEKGRNKISVTAYRPGLEGDKTPIPGLIVALRPEDRKPSLPKRTSSRGVASFSGREGNYIVGIHDERKKLADIILELHEVSSRS